MSERCGQSLIDAATGDAYDCTLAAGHEGRCKFDLYPAGRQSAIDAAETDRAALRSLVEAARDLRAAIDAVPHVCICSSCLAVGHAMYRLEDAERAALPVDEKEDRRARDR